MKLVDRVCEVRIQRTVQSTDERRFFVTETEQTVIRDLQVQFTVERHLRGEPNTCEMVITNLAAATRAQLQDRDGLVATLAAGHDNTPRLLFKGDIRDASSMPNGPDWHTTIHLGDGLRAYRNARATRSYRSGTAVITVLRDAARSMGLVLPREVETDPDLRAGLAVGFVLEGPTREKLTRLLAPFGYGWSIQNGRLQILRDDQVAPGAEREISLDTGMIGSPTFDYPKPAKASKTGTKKKKKKPTLSVDTLLYPELTPGEAVQIRSIEVNGRFKLDTVTHKGDTHGDDWTTSVEAKI